MPFPGDTQWRLDDFTENSPFRTQAGKVVHPLLREGALDARDYQVTLAEDVLDENLLAVLPTGLGKTAIAALAAAEILRRNPDDQVLVLAPTRPLAEQHARFLRDTLHLPPEDVVSLAGRARATDREHRFTRARIAVSTPQGVANDVHDARVRLDRVALLVVDEAHRATGDYAYVPLTQAYRDQRASGRVLALTASPGGRPERIREVVRNLGVTRVEARETEHADVRPYVKQTHLDLADVTLPGPMVAVRDDLQKVLQERLVKLKPFLPPETRSAIGKGALLDAGDTIRRRMARAGPKKGFYFAALLHHGVAVQALHSLELLETQGMHPLEDYLSRLMTREDAGRAQRAFRKDPRVQHALEEARRAPVSHPKEDALLDALDTQFREKPDSRVLVFAQYRSTVQRLVDRIHRAGFGAARFVGQADRTDDDPGLDQAAQARVLERFGRGDPPVLVATSVAEEGLHVPSVDVVIFYEPVVSEIRALQRRGRTGRDTMGRVLVLVTRGTRDEAFLNAERRREHRMREVIGNLQAHAGDDNRSATTA